MTRPYPRTVIISKPLEINEELNEIPQADREWALHAQFKITDIFFSHWKSSFWIYEIFGMFYKNTVVLRLLEDSWKQHLGQLGKSMYIYREGMYIYIESCEVLQCTYIIYILKAAPFSVMFNKYNVSMD